jgi:hypothetical protein
MKGLTVQTRTFSDFGSELRRPFPVAEECYDCATFYGQCRAWPETRPFACGRFHRLPDVMTDSHGQALPPSRVWDCAADGDATPEQKAARGDSPHTGEACEIAKPKAATGGEPVNRYRRCGCGATLPKHKRLCDQCRAANRRQTMREYMRQRRAASPSSQAISDMPLLAKATHATHACGGDLPLTGLASCGCPFGANFCITERSPTGGRDKRAPSPTRSPSRARSWDW